LDSRLSIYLFIYLVTTWMGLLTGKLSCM